MATEKRKIYNSGPTPSTICKKLINEYFILNRESLNIQEKIKQERLKKEKLKIENDLLQKQKVDELNRQCSINTRYGKITYQEALADYYESKRKYLSYPCYGIPFTCPVLASQLVADFLSIERIEACVFYFNYNPVEFINNQIVIQIQNKQKQLDLDYKTAERDEKLYFSNLEDKLKEINAKNNELYKNNCYPFPKDYQARTKSAECNKSKEKIKKLKNQYFKLSKDILTIQYGFNGIKVLKIQQKILIESKPIIEEAIKKIEDVKKYVVGTEDEAQFFIITSEVKAVLAQNIKEQSLLEANLKNLLIKKEKTNNILKRTKKLLDLKIKQSIKLCN
jgi:hypothetical protein